MEIEERAPILKQQREDYEHAIAAVGGLTENLEAAREEVGLRRREADDARRDLNSGIISINYSRPNTTNRRHVPPPEPSRPGGKTTAWGRRALGEAHQTKWSSLGSRQNVST